MGWTRNPCSREDHWDNMPSHPPLGGPFSSPTHQAHSSREGEVPVQAPDTHLPTKESIRSIKGIYVVGMLREAVRLVGQTVDPGDRKPVQQWTHSKTPSTSRR